MHTAALTAALLGSSTPCVATAADGVQVGRPVSRPAAEIPSDRRRPTCLCQDGGELDGRAGVVTRAHPVDDAAAGASLEPPRVACVVVGFDFLASQRLHCRECAPYVILPH